MNIVDSECQAAAKVPEHLIGGCFEIIINASTVTYRRKTCKVFEFLDVVCLDMIPALRL